MKAANFKSKQHGFLEWGVALALMLVFGVIGHQTLSSDEAEVQPEETSQVQVPSQDAQLDG